MTTCPNVVKKLPVSTTAKPVTQTALVEVNRASIGLMCECVALGSTSNRVPMAIKDRKLIINS